MLPSIRIDSWDDWTRAYNEVSVWRGLIDAICVREGIGYRRLQAASANTNAVFLLDRAFALKIYSPFWDEYEIERALLGALEDHAEIPTPQAVASGHIADGEGARWPYLITRYCAARPYSELRPELTDAEAVAVAGQLGGIVRALHRQDAGQLATAATERTWSRLVSERRRAALSELTAAGVLDESVVGPLASLLDDAIQADLPASRVVVHGDLGPDHVFCARAEDGWRVAALIDFGDAKIGVPEYEWMPVWMGFCGRDAELGRAYLRAYDPGLLDDVEFPRRAAAWTLLHDFSADELTTHWRERGQPEPIGTVDELLALLCPASIFE